MASKVLFLSLIFLVLNQNVECASLFERSYELVLKMGKNFAPSLMTILECVGEEDGWGCAKEKAGKMLETWDESVQQERKKWQEAADAEGQSSGRAIEELPSKLGRDVEASLFALADVVQHGVARALSPRHHDDGGSIDTITISTGSGDKKKKKMKKKKQKPAKIHLVQMAPAKAADDSTGRAQSWVIGGRVGGNRTRRGLGGDTRDVGRAGRDVGGTVRDLKGTGRDLEETRSDLGETTRDVESGRDVGGIGKDKGGIDRYVGGTGRDLVGDMWAAGEKALDALAEHAMANEELENGVGDKSSAQEQRGKKKKKKKAILKLLVLGAVLKAKIATLLQILSFKLQVKFFIIALIGLAINLARFWLDLKKSHHHQPQKVIYYEHAQHQHHYDDHHEEEPGWGPWQRSMEPEELDAEIDLNVDNSPYRAQVERNSQLYGRPALTRV